VRLAPVERHGRYPQTAPTPSGGQVAEIIAEVAEAGKCGAATRWAREGEGKWRPDCKPGT